MPDETDTIPEPALVLSGPSPPDPFGPPGSMILSGASPALRDIPGDPNLSPEDQAALQSRLTYATGPGAPTWAQPKPAPQATDQLDPRMMQEAYSKLPIAQAEKAVAAAIRFQGMRGYQEDLRNGVAADQALARHAPMMFWQSPGSTMTSMMKAMTPPRMTPYQQGALDLARQRLQAQQQKPAMTPYQQEQINLRKQALAGAIPRLTPGDTVRLGQIKADMGILEKQIENAPRGSKEQEGLQTERDRLQQYYLTTADALSRPRAIPTAAAPSLPPIPQTITRGMAPTPSGTAEPPDLSAPPGDIKARAEEAYQAATARGRAARAPAPAKAAVRFKDKTGAVRRYTGSAQDPKADKDPAHWTQE
jgi:hypothetical protein